MSTRLDLVEASLATLGMKYRRRGDQIQGQCPNCHSHLKFGATLSREGSVLFNCFKGCSGVEMMDAMGLRWDQIKESDRAERTRYRLPTSDIDSLVIEYSRADRAAGKPISERDKERELEAFRNLRKAGKSAPEGMPTVMEIVGECGA